MFVPQVDAVSPLNEFRVIGRFIRLEEYAVPEHHISRRSPSTNNTSQATICLSCQSSPRPTGASLRNSSSSIQTNNRSHPTSAVRPCHFELNTISDSSSLPECTARNITCPSTISARRGDRPMGRSVAVDGNAADLFGGSGNVERAALIPPSPYN